MDDSLVYVGRIVAIGKNPDNGLTALYRISSRSFPNRKIIVNNKEGLVIPKVGHEDDILKNPFISYQCLSVVNPYMVVGNGSHTEIVAVKLRNGMSIKDTLGSVLLSFDYEPDSLHTPRICGVVDMEKSFGYMGIVTDHSLSVMSYDLKPGKLFYVATYKMQSLDETQVDNCFNANAPEKACRYILSEGVFAKFSHPVAAISGVINSSGNIAVDVINL